jgi:hypothetical protein
LETLGARIQMFFEIKGKGTMFEDLTFFDLSNNKLSHNQEEERERDSLLFIVVVT